MQQRPNIVFYFSDQQRWDTLGCYGQRLDVTPNLDALAAGGTRYENAFTCQPVCGRRVPACRQAVMPQRLAARSMALRCRSAA